MPETPYDRPDEELPAPTTIEGAAQFVLDRFVEMLIEAGGRELEGRCQPRDLPDTLRFKNESPLRSCGCGNLTLFELPYEGEDGSSGHIQACAVCDGGLRWPRIIAKRPGLDSAWEDEGWAPPQ